MPRTTPTLDPKAPIQVRFGSGLLQRIDAAATEVGVSRNTWIAEAADKHLSRNGARKRYHTTAEELMADRTMFMVRLEPLLVGLIDEAAAWRGLTRTIWLMDACLAALAARR